jgi:hypothetical protein
MIYLAAAGLRRVRRPDPSHVQLRPVTAVGMCREVEAKRARRRWLLAVAGAFTLSRLAYGLAGVRFDDSALHPANVAQVQWQLLPLGLLRHALGVSIWNLHSQPPLYNLFCGALLHLPEGWQQPVAAAVYTLLGLSLAIATFLLLVEFGIRESLAFALTVLVVADPAVVLYENWLSWSYPTAVLVTVGVYCLVRWLRTRAALWAGAAMGCFAAVVLTDATFQWPWLLAIAAVTTFAGRRHWRRVVGALAVPIVLTAGWYVKGALQTGSTATSTWLGMNLYQTTLAQAPAPDIDRLIARGSLDSLAARPAFEPLGSYPPRYTARADTGIAALDTKVGSFGVPNFNNPAYRLLSQRYLSDDLAFIRARPAKYASAVSLAAEIWALPADQYMWVDDNLGHIAGYDRWYDAAVMSQARADDRGASARAEFHGRRPPAADISWTAAAVTAVDVLVAPLVLVRRRKDRVWLAAGAAMWLTVVYSLAVTSLTEVGENMRFRFELGTVPAVLAAATVAALVKTGKSGTPATLRGRWSRRPPAPAGDSAYG